ncbi:SDR family oxidoreductase [Roseomonas sp. KE2513]|uniref:SDR family NAD(P)-dependent oxidoreductase n=1 Tax=Roseomonas sp. KE2513 TaxID=2479202 RepID=UPI0018DFD165|nr:SDR family oxidoreductase [Roseomonas sp. KE2513]MBI0535753.1 SDR family oxidoreductase [Roseomonas sp. KE2513]
MSTLNGKIAVILGGSGGIGAATARVLAEAGASVIVSYRGQEAAARALVTSLPGSGHDARPASMEDRASIEALAADVARSHGRCDVLVNSAGFTRAIAHTDLDALDDEFLDSMWRVNWRGPLSAVRAFRPLLEESEGLVVNISSIGGLNGSGSNLAYAAVKAATDSLTKSLARALAPKVRVMSVSPGVVETGFVPGRGPEANAKIAPSIPLKRVAQPEDVANAVLACATLLTYSTGSLILVDGGRAL